MNAEILNAMLLGLLVALITWAVPAILSYPTAGR